jgi:hypothetical protein
VLNCREVRKVDDDDDDDDDDEDDDPDIHEYLHRDTTMKKTTKLHYID